MPLKRLLLCICVLSFVYGNVALAQFQNTTANQDGIMVLDSIGRIFSAPLSDGNIAPYLFKELEDTSQNFQFLAPVAKDIEFVGHTDGSLKGAYVIDIFGGQFSLTLEDTPDLISSPLEVGSNNVQFATPVYFNFDVIEDIEIAPDWRDVTFGYKGYFILDADGVIHTLGETNLPSYVYYPLDKADSENIADATIVKTLFPETIDISGSGITTELLLQDGPLNTPMNRVFGNNPGVLSATPIYTYFGLGSDIARDLEISAEYVTLTAPSDKYPGVIENRTIAMTNGYYILDGYGAVHSARLPLDFDVNNDGKVLYGDDLLDPDFGTPINNTVLAPPWEKDRENLPYFGSDVAVDIEITPSGKGFYLLDSYGSVFALGDANFNFPPVEVDGQLVKSTATTPSFGVPIARDLALVPNKANASLNIKENAITAGFVVLDAFGTVHTAGLAQTFNVSNVGNNGNPITSLAGTYTGVEVTPLWLPNQPVVDNFAIGNSAESVSIAPNYRKVTAAFTTITSPLSKFKTISPPSR